MTVKKEQAIQRFIGLSTDTKSTGVAIGSTFFEYDTSDTYITYDGTNYTLKKSPVFNKIKTVNSTKEIMCSGAYAAGDVVTNTATNAWVFPAVVDGNGGSGIITHARVVAETSSASGDLSIDLYTQSPTCTIVDNSPNTSPVIGDVTAGTYIGRIDFPIPAAIGATGCAVAETTPYSASSGLPLPFTCASATNAVYGVVACGNVWQVAPSTELTFSLTIEKR